jgi:ureidoacrylate peracid hydrolase
MHDFTMPADIVERVVKRRGRAHIERFEPRRTALVVIDLQNAFMREGVAHTLCKMAPRIVPNVNRLAAALRAAGGTVVWVRTTADPGSLQTWSHYYDELLTPAGKARRVEALADGSIGHAFWSELDRRPEDLTVTKRRYSAFLQGSSDIEAQLRTRGLDSVLIAGCVTNVCCESSARDAMMLNFRTVMVSDGNAAATDRDHGNSLAAFYLTFGDVLTADEVISRLAEPVRQPALARA